ncbi:hypothetical protein [Janibacter hoylei]|uniref:hypothetical protein n=1 Tax=Janibacter hoylei TaxID=364298 RepID=UPI0014616754|nr:hypothetical protein [Janibacter hoylei]
MLQPFENHLPWSLSKLDEDLMPSVESLVLAHPREAVLICNFFGREFPSAVVSAINDAQERGVIIVSDITHAPFSPPAWSDDLTVISLRKTLPIGDGAVIYGDLSRPTEIADELDPQLVTTRRRAAEAKSQTIRTGGAAQESQATMRGFEEYLNSIQGITKISRASEQDLQFLRTEEIARIRTENSTHLLNLLGEVPGVSPLSGYTKHLAPAFVTCRVKQPETLQRKLAHEEIYCPIHWPQPARLKRAKWRNDLISFPIDQRYGLYDMERIVDAVSRHRQENT